MARYTSFVNDTDTKIKIKHDGRAYSLRPKSFNNIYWCTTTTQQDTLLPEFRLEGVELDRNISHDDLLNNTCISIFRDSSDGPYSFRTFQTLPSEDMEQVSVSPLWVLELRWTFFVNKTDNEIQIEYDDDVYSLNPKSSVSVRWFTYDEHGTLLPKITLKGIELDRAVSLTDLYDNSEITIFRSVDNTYSFQTLSNRQLTERVTETLSSIKKCLLRMDMLSKKVRIWHNQCEHLLDKYRGNGNIVVQVLDALIMVIGGVDFIPASLVNFICSQLICCMLEGEALLLFCSGIDSYTKAAFALSSPPPFVPTFSRFSSVLRELDWTLDFICRLEHHFYLRYNLFDNWEWCEKQRRLVSKIPDKSAINFGVLEEDGLEADGKRQIDDREALQTSLALKNSWFWARNEFRDKLKAIWRKRLLPPSNAPGPDSVPDCFWIDNPDFKYVEHIGGGGFKLVDKCKWLGETVAVAIERNISKQQLVAEAGLIARVQHANVVGLMGCAYKEDEMNNAKGFFVTELMEQDLESLIRHQQRVSLGFETTMEGGPFHLSVAVDIALQIVEAMIHLKDCGVIHRDLKPSNCLVSPKFSKSSLPLSSEVPMYYTVKLTDFGTSKMRGQDSFFHTRKLGTASYMAPELHGRSEEQWPYTWSADVYSFGMTCYKIFTGKDPFENNTLRDVSAIVWEGKRPMFPSGCSRPLKRLIESCWAQNPAARPDFQDIREYLWQLKLSIWAKPLPLPCDC